MKLWRLPLKQFQDMGFTLKYVIIVGLVIIYLRSSITGHSSHHNYGGQMPLKANFTPIGRQPLSSLGMVNVSLPLCPGLTKPPPELEKEQFLRITFTDTFVYSAYADGEVIRVISLRKINQTKSFTCQLWYRHVTNGVTPDIVQAEVKDIPRAHNPVYTASYILCRPSRRDITSNVFAVSITRDSCEKATNVLPVQKISKSLTSKFLVCVPPIHHGLNDYQFMVESIEFKRLLGVQRFVFYIYDVGEDLRKILLYYKSQGIVDLVNWPIPLRSTGEDPEIHYYGQIASINDCLYRYRHTSEYIVFQDIDEFIVPQGNLQNLSQLIEHRLRKKNRNSFQILNVFFPSLAASDVKNVSKDLPVVLRQNVREEKPYPYHKKAKCIVDPRRVETVGIHQVIHGDTDMDLVPATDAMMYHYRFMSRHWHAENGVRDTSVETKYGHALVKRLKSAWKQISKLSVLTS